MLKGKMLKVKVMKSHLFDASSGEVLLWMELIDLGTSY